jgi:hypothetical protein
MRAMGRQESVIRLLARALPESSAIAIPGLRAPLPSARGGPGLRASALHLPVIRFVAMGIGIAIGIDAGRP